MAFELPFPPFPHDSRGVPFIATPDDNNGYAVPSSQYFKKLIGDKYLWTPVSDADPLPTSDDVLRNKDFATQATLAQILAKIIENPATDTNQEAIKTALATLLTQSGFDAKADITLSALRDALRGTSNKTLTDLATALAPLATATNQDAAQTTLVAILNKIIAAPATEAKQTALNALVGEVQAAPTPNTLLARLKNLETKVDAIIADGLKLSGSYVEIGGVSFAVSGGDTLRGKAVDRPDAVAAHAVIPYCYYFSIDTGVVEATDGTNWVVI